nr:TetR family transcriptional regulator [Saccharopolyspora sp. HNM0983]
MRERKKEHTREAIEHVAIRLFTERGYEATPIEAICEAVLVSRRTFFRYFTSKEDVVLSRSRRAYALAVDELAQRPADEPYRDAVRAVFTRAGALFTEDRAGQLQRVRLLTEVPALAGPFLNLLGEFELLLGGFLADRSGRERDEPRVRLAAAAATTSFRVAAEIWRDRAGEPDLAALAADNLDTLLPDQLLADENR